MKKRVQLVLDDKLYHRVKVEAAKLGMTISDYVADALRVSVRGQGEGKKSSTQGK